MVQYVDGVTPIPESYKHILGAAVDESAKSFGHEENRVMHYFNDAPGPIATSIAKSALHEVHRMGAAIPVGYGSHHLGSADFCGATFFIACNLMLCFAVFFLMEAYNVPQKWRTSITCSGLVQLIAFYNYTFMKDTWVYTQKSPTVYRYTDWLITVPLLMAEFYLILNACGANTEGVFSRLMAGTMVMLFAGWMGETQVLGKLPALLISLSGWFVIVREITTGSAGTQAQKLSQGTARKAFNACKDIVVYGWAIYPLGYIVAFIIPGLPQNNYMEELALNCLYNLADLVNKAGFGMCVWACAKSDGR
jgi:bacteriorhodopsin